ncbi:hypothetical protein [Hyphomicrobium sp. DY-1]|uniref:hypothetical protein n=1 Tax=Hyphomicrobium sp. DY-1 TaxID=3075650 RepID=UPI0039C1860F
MTSHEATPLYREILACLERQRPLILEHCELAHGTPEERTAEARVEAEGFVYNELFSKYAEEALANPTLQHVGELTALWRFYAYDEAGEQVGIMGEDKEIQTLFAVVEKLTGVPVPKRPFAREAA